MKYRMSVLVIFIIILSSWVFPYTTYALGIDFVDVADGEARSVRFDLNQMIRGHDTIPDDLVLYFLVMESFGLPDNFSDDASCPSLEGGVSPSTYLLCLCFSSMEDTALPLRHITYALMNDNPINFEFVPGSARYVNEAASLNVSLDDAIFDDSGLFLGQEIIQALRNFRDIDLGAVYIEIITYYVPAALLQLTAYSVSSVGVDMEAHLRRVARTFGNAFHIPIDDGDEIRVWAKYSDNIVVDAFVNNFSNFDIESVEIRVMPNSEHIETGDGTTQIQDTSSWQQFSDNLLQLERIRPGVIHVRFALEVNMSPSSLPRNFTAFIIVTGSHDIQLFDYINIHVLPEGSASFRDSIINYSPVLFAGFAIIVAVLSTSLTALNSSLKHKKKSKREIMQIISGIRIIQYALLSVAILVSAIMLYVVFG